MDEKHLTERALTCAEEAMKAGAEQAEAYLIADRSLTVTANSGRVENILQANPVGLGLRVIEQERQGFVFTSDFRLDSLKTLAAKAVFLAGKGTPDDANGLPEELEAAAGSDELRIFDRAIAELDPDAAIALVLRMEKAAYDFDKRVKSTQACNFSAGEECVVIANGAGRSQSFRSTSSALVAGVVAQNADGPMQSAFYFSTSCSLSKLEKAEHVGAEAARRAVSLLGATSVKAQRVPVVLSPEVAAEWMSNIFYALDGEEALKNTTFLSDKLGEKVGSTLVTLVDDGIMPEGVMSRPFDAEGVPTAYNVLIDKGKVSGFVYNTYSARRAQTHSTGNASRGYDAPPGVGHHNLHLKPGKSTAEEIIASVKNGLYVVSTGAFGFNPNTGDYSYEAAGLWIKDGALSSPVHEITIASNSLEMLAGVDMVANDLKFRGSANAPTIRIAEMAIAGREG
jgi:PmbA protein